MAVATTLASTLTTILAEVSRPGVATTRGATSHQEEEERLARELEEADGLENLKITNCTDDFFSPYLLFGE